MKILYTNKEAFKKASKFFNACGYCWDYEERGNDWYLITVIY